MATREREPATAHERASWDRVITALEKAGFSGRDSGSWSKHCCPVHESDGRSHNPSLGVKYMADLGRTKIECFADCPDTLVMERIGLQISDLYDAPLNRGSGYHRAPVRAKRPAQVSRAEQAVTAAGFPQVKPSKDYGRQTGRTREVATYQYTDATGQVVGEVVRRHTQFERGRKKDFFQRQWDTDRGRMEWGGFAPVPYQLPEVVTAIAEGRTIYVCEGEEDVNALRRDGHAATCNAAGAGKWKPEHAEALRGARRVVIIADRDDPGYRHADKVATSLDGLVGEVRIVQAADGKDLRDHFNAGHEIGELEPVPGLDYRTPIGKAGGLPSAGEAALTAGKAASLTDLPRTPELDGGSPMGEISGLGMNDNTQHQHDDSVDRVGSHFSQIVRLLLTEIMNRAIQSHLARKAAMEQWERMEDQKRREEAAAHAAKRKSIETDLVKTRKGGWDRLSRSQVAAVLKEAVSWSEDSEVAKKVAADLVGHIRDRWAVNVDLANGYVTLENATPQMLAKMAAAEGDRATGARLSTAQDRMVSMIAAEEGLDEDAKRELYAQVEQWRKAPSPQNLSELGKKLKDAKVTSPTRGRIKFAALYLGGPAGSPLKITELGARSTLASAALRQLDKPLVDHGEEVKNKIDTLLMDYQAKLKHGLDTTAVQARLADAVSVLTEDEQKIARERGKDIRKDPAKEFKALWPDHLDRDHLAAQIRAYAALAPQVEAHAAAEDPAEPQWVTDQRERATVMRREIDKALKTGKGLHPLEKDQIRAVLADVEAGKTRVPDMLLADDRSTAAIDRDRTDEIGHQAALNNKRQLEEILSTSAAPEGTARNVREAINKVTEEQARLASGRISLRDYEGTSADEKLLSGLAANGVPEPVRNQVKKHLDTSREDSAITGRQASRVQDRWAERREAVQVERAPKGPKYDSPERLAALEHNLSNAGLSKDEIRQCVAAETGRAKPPGAPVQVKPDTERKARTTTSGMGMQQMSQARHRGPDQDFGIGA